MEWPSGSKASSGRRLATRKRSNLHRRAHSSPEPHVGQDALTFLANYAEHGSLNCSNAHLNTHPFSVICGLPSGSDMRPDVNYDGGLTEPLVESGCLGNQNKLKKLKRKLDSITRPLHTRTAWQNSSGSGPVILRSSDVVTGSGVLQKQKSGTDRGGKRPCREEGHGKGLDVSPMNFEHVTSSSSSDSSLELVPADILYTSVQNCPDSSPSPQNKFDGPWPTWKKVPTNVRDQWFDEFQEWYYWQPEHACQIRLNFEARGMARLKDMFCTVRKDLSVKPFWLSSESWDTLKQYWESPEFKKISEQAKINRASDVDGLDPSLHTCGCIPMSKHKRRLEEKIDEEVRPIKLSAHTHQRKDKTWVDARSSVAYEKFMEEWNAQQSGENPTDLDRQGEGRTSAQPTQPVAQLAEAEVWVKSNKTKGTIYGLGAETVNYKCSDPSTSQSKDIPPLWFDNPEFQEFLSKKIMEISSEWNARLEEERRQTEELRKRVAELEKEKQEKKSKMKAKKKLKQMKEMMKMLQMSYESLSKAHSTDDDDDDSTDSD
uniref:Uncharacterized protein n=1 Tax=Opuntia streptacantha TaxID=393608 RepID=A0A7C9EQG9_OPUST